MLLHWQVLCESTMEDTGHAFGSTGVERKAKHDAETPSGEFRVPSGLNDFGTTFFYVWARTDVETIVFLEQERGRRTGPAKNQRQITKAQ